MKRLARAALLSVLVLLPSVSACAETLPIPGYDRMDVPARHRAQSIAASLWYPAGRATYRNIIGDSVLFEGAPAMVAAVAEGRYPLLLLAHGSGGAMEGVAWLSSRLAARGAIVLAVNHPGTTSGDSSPHRTMRLAPRAADLGAAQHGRNGPLAGSGCRAERQRSCRQAARRSPCRGCARAPFHLPRRVQGRRRGAAAQVGGRPDLRRPARHGPREGT